MHVGDGGERRTLQAGRAAELRLPRSAERPPESWATCSLHPPGRLTPRREGLSASTGRHVTAGRSARLRAARPRRGARGTPPPMSPGTAPLRTPGRCAPRSPPPPRLGSARWGCWQVVLQETDSSGHWFSKRKKQNWPDPQSLPAINWETPQRGCDTLSAERGAGASQPPGGQPTAAGAGAYLALLEEGWVFVPSLCFSLGGGLMPCKSSSRRVTHPPGQGSCSHGAGRCTEPRSARPGAHPAVRAGGSLSTVGGPPGLPPCTPTGAAPNVRS